MIQDLQQHRAGAAGEHRDFQQSVLQGLRRCPKTLPSKYFYDRLGSRLFDAICELPEYYLTRAELAIMQRHSATIAAALPPQSVLIELGSGSSTKTRLLLDALQTLKTYVPVDISGEHLLSTTARLRQRYPSLDVQPLIADFTLPVQLPPIDPAAPRVVYFPGSTLGNFEQGEAQRLLRRIANLAGPAGSLLIGFDLQKDPAVIEAAYNDRQGITAAFNLNLLRRINRELGGNFCLDHFVHEASYDPLVGRIEMRLRAATTQHIRIAGDRFLIQAGEAIRTEYSHKYTLEGFARMAGEAGFIPCNHWLDEQRLFAVTLLNRQND